MSSTRLPFSSEYSKGSVTTSSAEAPVIPAGVAVTIPDVIATERQAPSIPEIETNRYGTGKPRRIIIRGKISSG